VTSSTEPVETELKFALGPQAREPLEAGLLRNGKSYELSATYFDTADLALFTHGYGLRVRRKGERFVQTLKSHGDGLFARGEWEADVLSSALDAAVLARTPAAEIATGDALVPLFGVKVRRTAAMVTHGASRIEASLDIGEVTAGDRSEAVEELELELIEGTPADLFSFARTLDAGLTLAFATKSERGYRLARGVVPTVKGHPASLRRLSAAIIHEDAESAATAAAELGVAFARRADAAFNRATWARILLDAAERAADTRV
jgi:inorganic triphosphatase YgiF